MPQEENNIFTIQEFWNSTLKTFETLSGTRLPPEVELQYRTIYVAGVQTGLTLASNLGNVDNDDKRQQLMLGLFEEIFVLLTAGTMDARTKTEDTH